MKVVSTVTHNAAAVSGFNQSRRNRSTELIPDKTWTRPAPAHDTAPKCDCADGALECEDSVTCTRTQTPSRTRRRRSEARAACAAAREASPAHAGSARRTREMGDAGSGDEGRDTAAQRSHEEGQRAEMGWGWSDGDGTLWGW
ncbi:hypothetical protein B0H10DRAFT_1948357 [Mycena sp. CBHHK59/15]|nr:hypothetical protein B0H10DRAFT_1948357 [Mycena sp. CBHHK59/15]